MADFNFPISGAPAANLGRRLTFTPDGDDELDLGIYAPGFKSAIQNRWGKHPIPGQQGSLKEDLGADDLQTTVTLQFVGEVSQDYYDIIGTLTAKKRGMLLHPRRGARSSVVVSVTERVEWTTQGNETTIVDIVFADAALNTGGQFAAGPSARESQVQNQLQAANDAMAALDELAFSRSDIDAREMTVVATDKVTAATEATGSYATDALDAFSLGTYGPSLQNELKALPVLVASAQDAVRAIGAAADTQSTILALEVMLFAATQLDTAIQAAQPIPIRTLITRHPGQGIYAFVQQHYGNSGKTPSAIRNLAALILRLNPQIRRPSLIPSGTTVTRPA